MRKVKLIQQANGSFTIESKESFPDLKGKKLLVLTTGRFSGSPDQKEQAEWEIAGDEGILMTEEEFQAVQQKLKASEAKAQEKAA